MGVLEEIIQKLDSIEEKLDNLEVSNPQPQKIFEVEEAAGYLGISKDKLYKLWRSHKLGYVKVGRRKVCTIDQLEEYIEKNKIEPAEAFQNNIRVI